MKENRVLVCDTETTGFPAKSRALTDQTQPRIVQLAALQYNPSTSRIEQSMCLVTKPDGWEIKPELTAIHGISQEYALANGHPEVDVIKTFLHLWVGEGTPLRVVGHNAQFDIDIISIAVARFFPKLLADWQTTALFCTQKESKELVQAKNKNGGLKLPKLVEAYKHFFGEEFDGQHSANADTVATLKVYLALAGA
jgi:DNA polymerase III epsilon subunit-like protein